MPRTRREVALEAVLHRLPSNTALECLKALVACLVGKTIDQKRNSEIVQDLDAGHVHPVGKRITEIEREEIQVIVNVVSIAIEFSIAVNLKVLPGIEQRPGGRGEADGADVEIRQAGALLSEDTVDPREHALTRGRIGAGQIFLG